ncbi:hypothetical protein, partial [Pseudomonas sp. BIC9C]|uniref:hypothetical protein n=1 Tax=Pseudomonas sp. BIC9C TaxID=3078458 RepID=UPI003A522416
MGFSQATEDYGNMPGGVPMMVVDNDAGGLKPAGVLKFFASWLAPAGARKTKPQLLSQLGFWNLIL